MRELRGEPPPASPPGTLVMESEKRPRILLVDYDAENLVEKEIANVDECEPYLHDARASVTWIDVRGIGHRPTFDRIREIFGIHPLALEDLVNVPQRPKVDVYPSHQLVIAQMIRLDAEGTPQTEQLGVLFGRDFVLTVQGDGDWDLTDGVRERLRRNRGLLRQRGAD